MRGLAVLACLGLMLGTGGCMSTQSAAPSTAEFAPGAKPVTAGRYRLSGEPALRPVQIGDDGVHTYIVWSEEQALPAVFAITAIGTEEMVDGYMRSGVFTIDRIHRRLVFRIDKKAARADRVGN